MEQFGQRLQAQGMCCTQSQNQSGKLRQFFVISNTGTFNVVRVHTELGSALMARSVSAFQPQPYQMRATRVYADFRNHLQEHQLAGPGRLPLDGPATVLPLL